MNNWIEMRGPDTKLVVLIDDYEKAAEAGTHLSRPLSPYTIKCYGKALRELDRLLGSPALSGFTLDAVTRVVATKRRKSASSARLTAAVAKTFSVWLHKAGRTSTNTMKDLGVPKFNGRRRAFTDLELRAILRGLRALPNKTRKRDLAVVLLAIGSGVRLREAWELALADTHIVKPLSESWAYIRWDTTKSGEDRKVRIAEDAAAAIHDYIASDRPNVDGPLFLRSDGQPFTYEGWGKTFGAIGDQLEKQGIKGFNAHRCRHEWATLAARNGATQAELCQEGGWKRGSRVPSVYIDEIPFEELQRRTSPLTAYLRRAS